MSRILVVDDEQEICLLVQDAFEKRGHEVDVVFGGEQALSALTEKRYDGMVLDLLMPGMRGEALLDHRDMFPDTAVIILTAHGSENAAIKALRARVSDYVQKPFALNDLVMLMERHIGRYAVGDFEADMAAAAALFKGHVIDEMTCSGGLFELFEIFIKNPDSLFTYVDLAQMLFKTYARHAEKRPDLDQQLRDGSASLGEVTSYLKPQMSRLRSVLKARAGYHVLVMRANMGWGWSFRALNPPETSD